MINIYTSLGFLSILQFFVLPVKGIIYITYKIILLCGFVDGTDALVASVQMLTVHIFTE